MWINLVCEQNEGKQAEGHLRMKGGKMLRSATTIKCEYNDQETAEAFLDTPPYTHPSKDGNHDDYVIIVLSPIYLHWSVVG